MTFTNIDIEKWERHEYFQHYFQNVPCTYSMSIKLDITKIIKAKYKLYPVMLYYLTRLVNRHQEFRMDYNEKQEVGFFSDMIPSYTVFHKESETFSILWTLFTDNLDDFCTNYEKDLEQFGNNYSLSGKPDMPGNCFSVSMIPWTTFEGFQFNLQEGYQYLRPIFTMGKYYEDDGRIILPLAVQVHHAVCDGYHLCRFLNELQEMINDF